MKENKNNNETENRQVTELTPEAAALMKRYRRQLTVILVTAIVAVALIIGATSAWFANNKNVQSSGMTIDAAVSSNLVISKASGTASGYIQDPNILSQPSPFAVDFTSSGYKLTPAQHCSSGTTYLRYNDNPEAVSITSGYKAGTTDLTFDVVPEYAEGDSDKYYQDYTVYIAATGAAMANSDLKATITAPASVTKDYHYAASVDFYINSVDSKNYKGTLNLAKKGMDKNSASLTDQSIQFDLSSIPLNTSGNYITVIMRFYFDGNLEQESGKAYVRSEGLTTSDLSITVNFEAVAKS